MTEPSASWPSGKSPLLAALISVPMPGVGHLYAGAMTRGLVILLFAWFGLTLAASAFGPFGVILVPIFLAWAARDAWKAAERENAEQARALAAGAPRRKAVEWSWAAARAAWILPVPALGGAALAVSAASLLLHGRSGAIGIAPLAAALLALAWFAVRHTRDVLRGTRPMTEAAMLDEIAGTALVAGTVVVLILIVAPAYRGLFRKSAEGAMKGNLAGLRQSIERYKGVNGGRPPRTLAALTIGGALPVLPELWPSGAGVPHERTNAVRIVASRDAADSGKWAYVVSRSSPDESGAVFIDCTHTDTRGSAWSSY